MPDSRRSLPVSQREGAELSKKVYLIARSVVAVGAFAAFFWLFLTPPTIQSKEGVVYAACHPVGWNFNGDSRSWSDDFDIESPSAVQKYADQTSGYKSRAKPADDVKKGIHRACKEARHERGIVIIAVVVILGAAFVSIPKPKPSNDGKPQKGELADEAAHDEPSSEPPGDESRLRGNESKLPGNESSSEPSDARENPERPAKELTAEDISKPADNESRFKPSGNEPKS